MAVTFHWVVMLNDEYPEERDLKGVGRLTILVSE